MASLLLSMSDLPQHVIRGLLLEGLSIKACPRAFYVECSTVRDGGGFRKRISGEAIYFLANKRVASV